jgi:hypothetical protein
MCLGWTRDLTVADKVTGNQSIVGLNYTFCDACPELIARVTFKGAYFEFNLIFNRMKNVLVASQT